MFYPLPPLSTSAKVNNIHTQEFLADQGKARGWSTSINLIGKVKKEEIQIQKEIICQELFFL